VRPEGPLTQGVGSIGRAIGAGRLGTGKIMGVATSSRPSTTRTALWLNPVAKLALLNVVSTVAAGSVVLTAGSTSLVVTLKVGQNHRRFIVVGKPG